VRGRQLKHSITAIGVALLVAGGCSTTRTPVDPAAKAAVAAESKPLTPDVWPARWTEGLHPFVCVEPRKVELKIADQPGGKLDIDLITVRRAMQVGQGLVAFTVNWGEPKGKSRAWDEWESDEAIRGVHQFNFYAWDSRERPVWDLPKGRSESADDLVSFQRAANRASITARFRLVMPEGGAPRGTVLFVPPISAASLSLPVPKELVKHGWAVLTVDRLEVLQSTRSVMVIDVPWEKPKKATGPKVKPAEPPPNAAGRWMAEWIRGDMADMAYAFEAGLKFAERSEPVLADKPVVVLGTSLGAIFTPPVVQRLGDRVRSAVLIGGGANMLRIMAETDPDVFNIGLLYGEGDIRLNPERGKLWEESYLKANPLDPLHTAPILATIPTLMIHAKRDGIVPHQYGDLLWEKAGKPERWSYDAGHIWLFVTLGDRADEISDWIDAHTPGVSQPAESSKQR